MLTFTTAKVNNKCPGCNAGRGEFEMSVEKLRNMVLASLLAALIAAGSYIQIPIGPVPIVLTNLFVLLSGLLLGSRWGLASVGVYLLVGAMGMPVFAGGKGGLAHFLGPTGGYLLGYALSVWGVGCIAERAKGNMVWEVLAVILGVISIYAVGVPWLKMVTRMSWTQSLMIGVVPFLVGDALKASAALILARAVRPILNRQRQSLAL